jgi:hypothetical protein
MASGTTKDLPGFDRLTGHVAFTAALLPPPEEPGRAVAKELFYRSGPSGTDEYVEEAHHVPGDALLEH